MAEGAAWIGLPAGAATAAKPGTYRWYCALACDAGQGGWAMGKGYAGIGKEGYMAGFIVVLPPNAV